MVTRTRLNVTFIRTLRGLFSFYPFNWADYLTTCIFRTGFFLSPLHSNAMICNNQQAIFRCFIYRTDSSGRRINNAVITLCVFKSSALRQVALWPCGNTTTIREKLWRQVGEDENVSGLCVAGDIFGNVHRALKWFSILIESCWWSGTWLLILTCFEIFKCIFADVALLLPCLVRIYAYVQFYTTSRLAKPASIVEHSADVMRVPAISTRYEETCVSRYDDIFELCATYDLTVWRAVCTTERCVQQMFRGQLRPAWDCSAAVVAFIDYLLHAFLIIFAFSHIRGVHYITLRKAGVSSEVVLACWLL
jgi:hypothetical protein